VRQDGEITVPPGPGLGLALPQLPTPFAAPGLGIITGAIMLGLGWLYLERRASTLGAGFGEDRRAETVVMASEDRPAFLLAAPPLVLVIAVNLLFTFVVIPAMDTDFLAQPLYGETDVGEVRGVWSIIAALTISCLVLVALNWRRLGDRLVRVLDAGAGDSLKPIFNTASLVGFGAVMASLSGFILICDWVVTVGGDNPLISLAVATSLLAGMTGSASGGMSIALSTLGDVYLDMAQAAGIAPDLLHRVTAVATGGLDALPDNGAVITLLTICGLTHREAYRDIAVVALGIPIIALVILIVLGTLRATSSKKSARTGYPRRRRWCPRKRNVSARPSCQSMPLALARATPSIAGFGSRPAGPARSAAASTMPSWCRAASASGRAVALGQVPQSGARPRHRPNIARTFPIAHAPPRFRSIRLL
jgi:H+/gluconate symporter-like permease